MRLRKSIFGKYCFYNPNSKCGYFSWATQVATGEMKNEGDQKRTGNGYQVAKVDQFLWMFITQHGQHGAQVPQGTNEEHPCKKVMVCSAAA